MKLRNSLTPYPILCGFNADYKDSSFDASIRFTSSSGKIKGDIAFRLDNEEMKELIKQGKAVYLVHVESPLASYRKKFTSKEDHLQLTIEKEELASLIEVCTFVVATTDIEGYHSASFNTFDSDLRVALSKGNILAIGLAQEIELERKNGSPSDADSLIKIRKNTSGRPASIYVDTDNDDCILLGLNEDLFDLYCETARGKYKQSVFSMLFLPAMVVILERMIEDYAGEERNLEEKKWYKPIVELLDKNGYALDSLSLEDDTALEAAQVIFKNPISAALNELATLDYVEEE